MGRKQQKIATILSTWDKAINNLETLISEKETLKKGLMQVLLTGKKRFPGFTEEWKESHVSEVFEYISSNSLSRAMLTYDVKSDSVYNIHYGDIHSTFHQPILDLSIDSNVPVVAEDVDLPERTMYLREGDVIMADASEDYAGVGEVIELKNVETKKVIGGLHTFVLRDKSDKTALGFRTYLFKHRDVSRSLKVIATGSKVYGISKTNVSKVKLYLPSFEEQQKISSVLSAADKEIETLKKELNSFKEQKRGLMQKLLTGEVRVKTK